MRAVSSGQRGATRPDPFERAAASALERRSATIWNDAWPLAGPRRVRCRADLGRRAHRARFVARGIYASLATASGSGSAASRRSSWTTTGLIQRQRQWAQSPRRRPAIRHIEQWRATSNRWPETFRSMSSATSTSRSWSTRSTRRAARSQTRYDFKGAKAEFELGKDEIVLRADTEYAREGDPRPARVEGDPAQPVAQDLRLGRDRAGRRQHCPPDDRPAARPARGLAKKITQAHPRRLPEGQVADPGRRDPRQQQEQGRAAEGDRAAARGVRGLPGSAAVPELPLSWLRDDDQRARDARRSWRSSSSSVILSLVFTSN